MTKIIKKVLSVLTALAVIAVVLAGCSSSSASNDNSSSERASKDAAKFAVVAMYGSNGAFKDMADGIIDELVAKGYKKDNIVFKDAQGDATSLSTIINSLDDGSYSAILTVGTQATQTLVNIKSKYYRNRHYHRELNWKQKCTVRKRNRYNHFTCRCKRCGCYYCLCISFFFI